MDVLLSLVGLTVGVVLYARLFAMVQNERTASGAARRRTS